MDVQNTRITQSALSREDTDQESVSGGLKKKQGSEIRKKSDLIL